jgi:23S rRNA (cytidine1920-2'-O)/16S rRNA (cytidine1409-2'-O)-methyltransferase
MHKFAVEKVSECITSLGWRTVETIPSPITGAEGNIEFLLYARRGEPTPGFVPES